MGGSLHYCSPCSIGVSPGDSQVYLIGAQGGFQFLTTSTHKARLGSGNVKSFIFRVTLKLRDVLLLMTDGAWTKRDISELRKGLFEQRGEHNGDERGVH